MSTLEGLALGFANALTLANLGWALLGTTLGTAIGVLPGIGPALTVAVLLPVTFGLDPVSAFIMFGGIYYGAMYGGSTTSILLNTPGETGAIATAIDGHQMALKGRAAAALTTAAIGSFVAGTLATLALAWFAPALASIALAFGPAEYFALALLAFAAVTALLGTSLVRGLFSLFLGLALGLVGIDPLNGEARFSFGIPQLLDGIDVVILVIGLFAVGETLHQAVRYGREELAPAKLPTRFTGMSREEWRRSWKPWLRGTAIGFPLGVLPMGGSVIPTFLSYLAEKRLSAHPEEFGRGAIEGVAGPEAANNASAAGVLVPLLTLGLPSSATAAILLAAFQQYGLQPGPLLFSTRARSRLDADRELVHRQRHAAGIEPAARGCLGARDVAAAAAAVRRRARARIARRVHLESLTARRRPTLRRRRRSASRCACTRFRSCRPCSGSCSGRWPSSNFAARRRSAKAISRCS